MKLDKKVVVITGAAGLLGKVFANAISREGGIVVVADIKIENAQAASEQIPNSYPIKMDITSEESVSSVIAEVAQKFGKIHALVNNAYPRNKNYGRHFFDVTYEDFCENLNLNLGGYFLTSQRFLKYFEAQEHGNIVNISSVYGVVPPRFEVYDGTKMTMPVEYAAIKSGLIHLTKYMAKYVKNKGIRVNCISPGGILDAQPEQFLNQYREFCLNKGMLQPSDLAGTLVFLLSSDSEFINGQNIIVDDGFTL
ncbi:flagellin modification protein A [Bdellovibrio bacteriovorus]|uniref:Flagellin modification protein A n=1 Tax=Bdellovibrio bacteriovorus TaxID=959 RepID=A0A162G2Q4_BDEBC|nr:oxidoreductase [Bdellovibrio bacteriovorus]KYG64171.1 flagellin modification protein A [Bdellovibrio bacteriovorus]